MTEADAAGTICPPRCYIEPMNKALNDIVRRADGWPDSAREELTALAREIEAEVNAGAYYATPEELAGIDRGLRDSAEGRFATEEQVEAVFIQHRPTHCAEPPP